LGDALTRVYVLLHKFISDNKIMEGCSGMKKIFAALLLLYFPSANASLVVPVGLNPGDTYHVIFVSSTVRDATSSNITDYDAHVQAAADVAGIGTSIGVNWLALASTESISAKDHLAPAFTDPTAPIYNQNGDLISATFLGLWDGALDAPVLFDEHQMELVNEVWTGTNHLGNGVSPIELGAVGSVNAMYGNSSLITTSWVEFSNNLRVANVSLYGVSGVLTVSQVPLPAAVWLFGTALIGLVGFSRRRTA
jgi:hypothetical protein